MEGYLAALPLGLDAHPNCLHKGSIMRQVLRAFPTDKLPRLPEPVQTLLNEPPLASSWVREVHATALYMAICDAHFPNDDAYVTFSADFNRKLLRSPLYRFLMFVATPNRLMHHAGLRWSALHRGSTLVVKPVGEKQARGRVTYPTELFPALLLRCFATAFQAAIEGSGGQNARLEMRLRSSHQAEYDVFWE
jgi:Protein of unknown function (DUF2378)